MARPKERQPVLPGPTPVPPFLITLPDLALWGSHRVDSMGTTEEAEWEVPRKVRQRPSASLLGVPTAPHLQSMSLLCTSALGRPPLASLQKSGFIFQNGSQRPHSFCESFLTPVRGLLSPSGGASEVQVPHTPGHVPHVPHVRPRAWKASGSFPG